MRENIPCTVFLYSISRAAYLEVIHYLELYISEWVIKKFYIVYK